MNEQISIKGEEKVTILSWDKEDPMYLALQEEKEKAGLKMFRIWKPETISTMDLRSDRLNVRIAPDKEGVWKIIRVYVG